MSSIIVLCVINMKPYLYLIIINLLACNGPMADNSSLKYQKVNIDDKIDSTAFYPYKNQLFMNLKGELAYRTFDQTEPSKPAIKFLTSTFTDTLGNEQETDLKRIIDSTSFIAVGNLYYKDKKHVYFHNQMMDGGTFFIVFEADPESFEVLDSSYFGRDKQFVFCRGGLLEGADNKTFMVMLQSESVYYWTAKDKHRMYDGCNKKN